MKATLEYKKHYSFCSFCDDNIMMFIISNHVSNVSTFVNRNTLETVESDICLA
jgi:Cys-tRNA synthase (O-phospho-L-seryl-tRNA:Cys-tRNA synthase)